MYKPKTAEFTFFDLTKNPENIRADVNKSFSNMDSILDDLRRIVEIEGNIKR